MGLRLDTKLSRLLLDEGTLQSEALEEAVQQQVVHGGGLDTLLLELNLVSEEVIGNALIRAWNSERVTTEEREDPDALAVTRLPSRMAIAMGLCPFRLDEDGLHVLAAAPVDQELLAEVGGLCGFDLVAHVVPEVRLHEALHRAYGVSLEDRYRALLDKLDGKGAPLAPRAALFEERTEVRPPDASAERALPSKSDEKQTDISPAAAADWDIVEALAHLAAQDRREGIAQVAVSFALRFVPFAAVFGVRAGYAVGWHRAGPCEGNQFHGVQLAVPDASVVKQVLDSPSPLIGKPPITDGNTKFLTWLGRRRPRTALLIPIVVARRTVGILYADGGVRARDIQTLSDLVAFGARIGPAFEALLRARHRAHADLFPPRPTLPSHSLRASKRTGSGALDGTSPFARNYTGPIAQPPQDDVTAPTLDDGMRPLGAKAPEDPVAALASSLANIADDVDGSDITIRVRSHSDAPDEMSEDDDTQHSQSGANATSNDDDFDDVDTINSNAAELRYGHALDDEGRLDGARSDEEGVTWSGALDDGAAITRQASDDGSMLSDDSLVDFSADRINAINALRESPNDEPPSEDSRRQRKRRAPLLFDDRTEPLAIDGDAGPPLFSDISDDDEDGDHSDVDLKEVISEDGPIIENPDLVFPEFPRESESDVAWTGALQDTVERGMQGGSSPALTSPDVFVVESDESDEVIGAERDASTDFSLPPPPDPAEPLPAFTTEIPRDISLEMPPGFEALHGDVRLAPPPFPLLTKDAQVADSLAGDIDEAASSDVDNEAESTPPALVPLPEVAAHTDSQPPQGAAPFASLIEGALPHPPVDDATVTVPANVAPPPVLDDAIELHTADVDVSHSLVDDGPYLDDVIINDAPTAPPIPAEAARHFPNVIPNAAAEASDDPYATQPIDVDSATNEELVEDLESLQEDRVEAAKNSLIERGVLARVAVTQRFPGRLLIDVLSEGPPPSNANELGPLIEVVVALGKEGVLCAIPHLNSRFPAFRYAAVYVLRTLFDDRAIDVLVPLLQDPEPRVRLLVVETLGAHIANPRFEIVLNALRPLVREKDPAQRARGANLLGRFRDVASVPNLITLADDKNESVRAAAIRGLMEVSLQDLGPKAKAWRKWWDKARKLSRIDWLVEGLRAQNRGLRRQAISELRSLTGDDFGYRVDDTRRQREAATARFRQWWDSQRQR